MTSPRTVTLAFTGASGLPYGMRLLEVLLASGVHVRLIYTKAAQMVASQEMGLSLPARASDARRQLLALWSFEAPQLDVYGNEDYMAPIASGSNPSDAMVICPCTMGTLAAVAHGLSENLIQRAADVSMKERRPLILVPRETPFSSIHLENMLTLSRAGAIILPPNPGFYEHPNSLADLIDFVVARILDQLKVPQTLMHRWGE